MIDWDVIAPMIVAVVLILTGGGVLVLRPIAKRISELPELYARDRSSGLERDVGPEPRRGPVSAVRGLMVVTTAALGFWLPAPAAAQGVYRTVTVQAAPGDLFELIELYREERALLTSLGQEPPLWMRHSQGDVWDVLLLYPIESASAWLDDEAAERRASARAPSGRTGAELQREIDARSAWRDEVFVAGPPVAEVRAAFSRSGFFHVEMFEGLAGKRAELIREREMENDYLERIGREPNHVFTRIAGSSTDAFTIGYYRDLAHYGSPPERTAAERDAAARAAGFAGADYIGAYLRELILRHHDTLAVEIP